MPHQIDQRDHPEVVMDQSWRFFVGAVARAVHRAGFAPQRSLAFLGELAGVPTPAPDVVTAEEFRLHGSTDLNLWVARQNSGQSCGGGFCRSDDDERGELLSVERGDGVVSAVQAAADLPSAAPAVPPARGISAGSHGREASWRIEGMCCAGD